MRLAAWSPVALCLRQRNNTEEKGEKIMIKRQHGSQGIKQREKIIHKAAILMDKKGYNGVSIQDIADLAKIHKSTFYHYFRSKSELLQTVLEKPVEEILERMNKIINDSNLSAREKL
ncbi:MAG: TetR/AcrR family transcriptional regulator, partial [Deltaproteobacteria bacterium]|nr:TetR/AcrR family transcriptional regulator [Deltaproteobacteria bacterium]